MSSNPESSSAQQKEPCGGKPIPAGDRFFTGLLEWHSFNGKKPRIVAITGSTKYEHEMREAAEIETASGHVVLMPHIFRHSARWKSFGISSDVDAALDALFAGFISLSDELLVVNPKGYIGEGTQRDIDIAKNDYGIPVRYTTTVKPEDIKHCFNPNCNSKESALQDNGDVMWRVCKQCGACGPSEKNEYAADTAWNSILRYGNER